MDKKKIGAGFAGALQKAADATKAAKLAVQDMAADAKQSREKKKADAQKTAAAKELIAAAESEKGTAPVMKSIATRNALQIIYYLMAADGTVYHSEEEKFDAIGAALDPNFADSKPTIIKDCQAQLEKIIDSEDYLCFAGRRRRCDSVLQRNSRYLHHTQAIGLGSVDHCIQ